MTPRFGLRFPALPALFALALLFVACDDGGTDTQPTATSPAIESPTAAAGETPATPAGETPAATEEPFAGGRDPVAGSTGASAQGSLVDVRTGEHEGYDRIAFEFADGEPDYRVEYVDSPAQCGSGEPVALTGTQAALQVKFTPGVAHNETGAPTFGVTELTPGLATIVQAVQTCDFEADVTWVLILSEPLDFRVIALTGPIRLAVDIAQR